MGCHLIPLSDLPGRCPVAAATLLAPIYHNGNLVRLSPHKDRVESASKRKRQAQHLASCLPHMEPTYPRCSPNTEASVKTLLPSQTQPLEAWWPAADA